MNCHETLEHALILLDNYLMKVHYQNFNVRECAYVKLKKKLYLGFLGKQYSWELLWPTSKTLHLLGKKIFE